jgi:hypothetical protein
MDGLWSLDNSAALTDPNPEVRVAATNTLLKIDPKP